MNLIEINELKVQCFVGVTDEELSRPQVLLFDISIRPTQSWSKLNDNIRNTIDYVGVVQAVEMLVQSRPRRLIETMAEELADMLLKTFPVNFCRIRIQKYILPQTRSVAVVVTRSL
jgi:dihydroneopterin aldolase